MGKTSSYHDALIESLKDPEEAREYLNAALEDSPKAFLKALKNVAQANSMAHVAREAGIQRETLYRSLSETGNPTWETLLGVLTTVGFHFTVAGKECTTATTAHQATTFKKNTNDAAAASWPLTPNYEDYSGGAGNSYHSLNCVAVAG
jgi:probable addiction module antidote protein